MANTPHLFKNMRLNNNKGQIDGINNGLEIKGEGTFKLTITNGNGKAQTIGIPNSLYVPKMKRCLLLQQHWAQEAGEEQTWMENNKK